MLLSERRTFFCRILYFDSSWYIIANNILTRYSHVGIREPHVFRNPSWGWISGDCQVKTKNDSNFFLNVIKHGILFFRGLGLETVFLNILRAYQDPGNLVIVLGTTDHEEQYFIEKLKSLGLTNLPMVINSQCSSNERLEMKLFITLSLTILSNEICIFLIRQRNKIFRRRNIFYIWKNLGGRSFEKSNTLEISYWDTYI